jgi:K+-sensing histidine kinase KdpD
MGRILDVSEGVLKKSFARYALAVVVVSASFLLRYVLVHRFGFKLPPFIISYPAIMLVALLAGLWAGLLATALAVLATAYLVMPPIGSFAVADTSEGISLALFAGMGIFMSLIAEHYRRSQRLIAVYKEEQALREGEDKLR